MIPIQQPIMLQGGNLPPLNVFHNPVWMQGKPEENQQLQNPNPNQMQNFERLNFLNRQLDEELKKYNSMVLNKDSDNQMSQQPQGYMNNNMNQCIFFLKFFRSSTTKYSFYASQ